MLEFLKKQTSESLKLHSSFIFFLYANWLLINFSYYSSQPGRFPWVVGIASPFILYAEIKASRMLFSSYQKLGEKKQIETADQQHTEATEQPGKGHFVLSNQPPHPPFMLPNQEHTHPFEIPATTANFTIKIGSRPDHARITFRHGTKAVAIDWGFWSESKTPNKISTSLLRKSVDVKGNGFSFSDDLTSLYVLQNNKKVELARFILNSVSEIESGD